MSVASEDFDQEEGLGEGEGEHTEQADVPTNPFTQEVVPECLSMLCKIGNGLAHAYVRMDCHDRELTDIAHMKNFVHVRYVDVSGNQLVDLTPLNHLSHLLLLKANKNNLATIGLEPRPYLQIVDLSENKLIELEGLDHPQLARLNLNSNMIASVDGLNGKTLRNLHTLELRGNKLTTINGLALPCLEYLYLAANLLKDLQGIDKLISLKNLHVRENQIAKLDGFSDQMKQLEYINIRGNELKTVAEMEKLACLPELKTILLSENPCSGEDGYRVDVVVFLQHLKRLDKDDVTATEKEDAEELLKSRQSEEEETTTTEKEDTED